MADTHFICTFDGGGGGWCKGVAAQREGSRRARTLLLESVNGNVWL